MSRQIAQLVDKRSLNSDIADFRFELQSGRFTGLEPGAHIDVKLGDTLVRQYSIWDWDPSGTWVNVAVKREDSGRGGSLAMHALEVGAVVEIGGPRNNFRLVDDGDAHKTLIAGGIGVTPILAMARQLRNQDADFRVIYLVRSRSLAAMHHEFEALDLGDKYQLHCDDTDGMFDLCGLMQSMPVGGDIYTCGPEPMLNAVLEAGAALRGGSIHFERFAAAAVPQAENATFEIEIESTGAAFSVGPSQTILGVLHENGINVDFGCSEGLCGSCMVDVASGEVDHRDGVLSPDEQAMNAFMCVCVSRAKSEKLVLRL